ncbi:MAG: nitroreductase family protein [Clostridia bacterium]|nr:nitroreductase family protein [Clostridia bacterium]
MTDSTVFEKTYSARSVRVFDRSKPVGREALTYFVECARVCPTAANLQPLKYVLVDDCKTASSLFALTKWAGYLKDVRLPPEGCEPTDFIVMCHDTDVCKITDYSTMDVGICAQTINLAAREKGFALCMIGSFDKEETAKLLSLPENLVPVLVLAIGTPAEAPIICSVGENGSIKYFRDDRDLHFVPKRSIKEVIVK